MLVAAKTSGATPLVIACRNGHYDVAEYLIEKCHADLEQPGSGELILLSDNYKLVQNNFEETYFFKWFYYSIKYFFQCHLKEILTFPLILVF